MDTTGDSKDILTAPANEAYQPEFSAAEVAAYDELIDVGGRLHDIAERTGRESYMNAQFDCGVLMAAVTLIDSGVAGDYPGKVREIERRIINRIRYALESVSPAAGREISAPTPTSVDPGLPVDRLVDRVGSRTAAQGETRMVSLKVISDGVATAPTVAPDPRSVFLATVDPLIVQCRAATRGYREAWAKADAIYKQLKALGVCASCAISEHRMCRDYTCECCAAGK